MEGFGMLCCGAHGPKSQDSKKTSFFVQSTNFTLAHYLVDAAIYLETMYWNVEGMDTEIDIRDQTYWSRYAFAASSPS